MTAYMALLKLEKDNAYSNIALDVVLSKSIFSGRDRAFISALFYGVIERKLTLDYQLSLYLSKPLKKLKTEVLTVLRMGAYQILFMDKVPDSAAVNESINIAKKTGQNYASGLINAVLRKICQNGLLMPNKENFSEYLSVKYSCPEKLIKKWIEEYGKNTCIDILEQTVGVPEIFIRVNNCKISSEALVTLLTAEGISTEKTEYPYTLKINLAGHDIEKLDSFKKGYYHVQDLASQLCSAALQPEKGDTVFDLCAAPGGKTYTIAEIMENEGRVLSFDIHKSRVDLINSGASRLGLTIVDGKVGDACIFNSELGLADRVLCDVPCSGLGIIRRKPEIKYKNPDDFKELPEIQYKILANASRYLKVGGVLVYSTCTVSKAENECVCDKFLVEHPGFIKKLPYKTFIPGKEGSDGFFIAVIERVK